jgi:hypothetical protein
VALVEQLNDAELVRIAIGGHAARKPSHRFRLDWPLRAADEVGSITITVLLYRRLHRLRCYVRRLQKGANGMVKILMAGLMAAALGGCGPHAAQVLQNYNQSVQNNQIDYSRYNTQFQPIGGNSYTVRPGYGPNSYIVQPDGVQPVRF